MMTVALYSINASFRFSLGNSNIFTPAGCKSSSGRELGRLSPDQPTISLLFVNIRASRVEQFSPMQASGAERLTLSH